MLDVDASQDANTYINRNFPHDSVCSQNTPISICIQRLSHVNHKEQNTQYHQPDLKRSKKLQETENIAQVISRVYQERISETSQTCQTYTVSQ